MITTIRRNDANDSVDRMFDYTAADVENVGEINSTQSNNLSLVLDEFRRECERTRIFFKTKSDLILTPEEILAFSLTYQLPEKNMFEGFEGEYLSKLIQNSYNHGHNDFTIARRDNLIQDHVASWLEGSEDNPIKLTVNCGVGRLFGFKSQYLTAKMNHNAGYFLGLESQHLDITVGGNCGYGFGDGSHYMSAHVMGDIEHMGAGNNYDMDLVVDGDLLYGINSYRGNFKISGKLNLISFGKSNVVKVSDQAEFDRLKEKDYRRYKSNKLIGPNGEEVEF
jgi:hypothetical protein